ncbi:hypothetical protein [Carp edema virus]|nr:hypothetical protein [Carp edema virus]
MVVLSKVKEAFELFRIDVTDIKEKCESKNYSGLREDLAKYYCQTETLFNSLLPSDKVDYSKIHFKNLELLSRSQIFNRVQVMQRFITRQSKLLPSFEGFVNEIDPIFQVEKPKVYLSDNIPSILMTGMQLWDFTDKACRVEKAERKIEECREALMALCSSTQKKFVTASKIKNSSSRKAEEKKIANAYKLGQEKLNGKIRYHSAKLVELGRSPNSIPAKRATI